MIQLLYEESMPEYIFDKYEETHPHVHFNVERAVGFEGGEPPSVSAIADAVKVLNTRILANDAPDIIVTDRLPISSYIERDVFEDLSEVVDSVTAKEAYFENILNTYKVDDKVHAIPMKFLIPAIYRDESKEEAWIDRRHYGAALKTIYATNFHTCFDEDNSLNQERTKKFLEDAKKLWETSVEDMRGCTEEERMEKYIYYPLLSMSIDSQIAWSNPSVSIGCAYDARTLQELAGAVKGKDAEWKLLNLDGNTYYVPDTSFAISKSSYYKKEAMEFLKYVLADAEMQKEGFFGGFQIHKDRFREELQEKMYPSKTGTTDEDMVEIPVKQLSDKKCEKFIRDIEKSIPIDTQKNEMMDLVLEVCTKYINDEITLEEAVDEVISKVSLSMQE